MIGARSHVCTIVVLAAALLTATTYAGSPTHPRGGLILSASAVQTIDAGAGTTAGAVTVSGGSVHTTMKTEPFTTNAFGAAGCPGSWSLYPGVNAWFVAGGVANATGGSGGVGGRTDQAENGNPCSPAGLSSSYGLSMTARFSVRALATDNTGWYIGYAAYKTAPGASLCGPQVFILANPAGTPANVSWSLRFFDGGTTVTAASAAKWNSLRLYDWYTLSLSYAAGVATATVNGTTITLPGTWTTCGGGATGGVTGTGLVQSIGPSLNSGSIINVDDMTVRWPAQGWWTSPALSLNRVQSVALTVQIAQLQDASANGFLCGSCYMNTTSVAWQRSTQITTSGASWQALTLDDTQATTGSVSALSSPWTLTLRLNSTDGIVPTSVQAPAVTYTVLPPGGGPPNPTPTYCERNPLAPQCLQNQTIVQKVVAQVCNLWALIFALLFVAVAVWVRRAARRGPGPSPPRGK